MNNIPDLLWNFISSSLKVYKNHPQLIGLWMIFYIICAISFLYALWIGFAAIIVWFIVNIFVGIIIVNIALFITSKRFVFNILGFKRSKFFQPPLFQRI